MEAKSGTRAPNLTIERNKPVTKPLVEVPVFIFMVEGQASRIAVEQVSKPLVKIKNIKVKLVTTKDKGEKTAKVL